EAAGAGWQRALGPDDRVRLATELRAAAAGRPRSLEVRLGGVLTRVELSPFAGGRVVACFTDETARADAEQRLHQAEARFRARRSGPPDEQPRSLPALAAALVGASDASGRVDSLNRRFTEHTGLDVVHVRAQGLADAIHPDDRKMVATRWSRCLQNGS